MLVDASCALEFQQKPQTNQNGKRVDSLQDARKVFKGKWPSPKFFVIKSKHLLIVIACTTKINFRHLLMIFFRRCCFFFKESFLQETIKTLLLHPRVENKMKQKSHEFEEKGDFYSSQKVEQKIDQGWWTRCVFKVDGSKRWQTLCLPWPSSENEWIGRPKNNLNIFWFIRINPKSSLCWVNTVATHSKKKKNDTQNRFDSLLSYRCLQEKHSQFSLLTIQKIVGSVGIFVC